MRNGKIVIGWIGDWLISDGKKQAKNKKAAKKPPLSLFTSQPIPNPTNH
jgi:hypothetical protein